MAVSTEQYEAILARLNKLENAFNDMAVAIQRCVTLGQVQQLLAVIQADLASVDSDVDALEERVTAIEEEPLT
jgi:polyhydroxyalkanoate synthesis regulator phasin